MICIFFLISSIPFIISNFVVVCSPLAAKTGKRGTYNITSKRTKIAESLHIREEDDTAPDGYFTTVKGNLIPSRWKALYFFLKFGKAPNEWKETFENDNEMGSVSKESAAYIQPIAGK